jgi:hypothetical protein
MRRPLHFDRYSTEMLRNKARLSTERVAEPGRHVVGRRETPYLGNAERDAFPLKGTRIS